MLPLVLRPCVKEDRIVLKNAKCCRAERQHILTLADRLGPAAFINGSGLSQHRDDTAALEASTDAGICMVRITRME